MNGLVKIEIAVDEATARALTDTHRLRAIGRLIDRMVRPGADDPLAAVLEATASDAKAAGLGDAEIDAELTVYNAERRG
jgi:hypothetical protein